jgi:hypothetical protein
LEQAYNESLKKDIHVRKTKTQICKKMYYSEAFQHKEMVNILTHEHFVKYGRFH